MKTMPLPLRFRAIPSAMKNTAMPLLACLCGLSSLHAQQQNLIGNPGFERSIRSFSPWGGVSSSGFLESPTNEADILAQAGGVTPSKMPVSISAGDLNGDGLPDIAAMDGLGYLKIYFNTGTKTEPKFAAPEYASLFLNPLPLMRPVNRQVVNLHGSQGTQRIHLVDVMKTGKLDLLIGTYGGSLHFIPNSGGPARPDFRNPSRPEQALVKTGSRIWANILAPHAVDWNKDGRLDLLVGEGSYSANSIHILIGKKMGLPAFEDADRHVLAWGMGLEQLSPCVVDWNNDGHPDLLVTERGGRVALYLNPGTPWKPGDHLPFHSLLTVDGAPPAGLPPGTDTANPDPLDFLKATNLFSTGGISTISTADFNGDGLFDLVFGKRSGRIAIALNKGQPGQPKFGQPVDIKSTAEAQTIFTPSGWTVSTGEQRGNFFAYASAVKADANPAAPPAEGTASLVVGYAPPKSSFMPLPAYPRPATRDTDTVIYSPNAFEVTQTLNTPLQVGKTYILTFKTRGAQVNAATATLQFRGLKQLGEDRIVRGDRGAVKKELNKAEETKRLPETFSPGANWSEVRKEYAIKFDNRDLNTLEKTTGAELRISFLLAPGTGQIALDDFKLVEK
jgi:hypothetical protein